MSRLLILFVLVLGLAWTEPAQAGDASLVVKTVNEQFGHVCEARLSGWFTKTLRIDWTANTKKLHAMKVFAEIGSVKNKLYEDGVRYFQFPNDAGTYNVIDWKTGVKSSVTEKAPYHFTN